MGKSATIFSGGYAKVIASLGLKLKDDTTILSGSDNPSITNPSAPNGSIYMSSVHGLFQRKSGAWVKLADAIDAIDTVLVQNFDVAVLSDFTQTGMELISSPHIAGAKTARLIHQAASTYSFKQTY